MKPKPPRGKNPSRSLLLVATGLGLALALVGCTSDSGNRTPGSAPGQATTPGTGAQSPSPTVAGELDYVAGPELEAATSTWATTQEGAVFTSDAALRAQIPAAEKWLKDIDVDPKECGLYGIGSLKDQLNEAVMAAVTFPENVGADITVASYEDLNALVADVAAQQHLDESCGKYTIRSPQQEITTKLSDLKVATSAPYSAGTLMVTVNGRNTSKQVSVRAIDGHVMVTATRKAANNPDEATARAAADVEAILAVLREREAAAGTKP
ncbi:hypothetical protein ACSYDW_11215 [Paeniglutamicibacter sp. R2-26]|uniref:hypothetical protein n=1 Tax=Paeniglutamicibacter sp. R2-26 TaxID=3144417 RepID=UPI003EE51584